MNAYSIMRVDLVGLGEKEYVFGAPFLSRLATRFSGNFLCANLIDPGQTQSYFLPYIVTRKNNKRILITSILDPAYSNYLQRDKLKITDPVAALKRLKKDIRHDLFIVIGHGERKNILAWIDQVHDIDLLIQGHQPGVSRQAEKYKNTTIVMNNVRGGQYTAHIDVSWTPSNKVIISQPVTIRVNVRQTIQDRRIAGLIKEYEKWRREFLQQQAGAGPAPPLTANKSHNYYLGIQSCKSCHPKQLQAWQKTTHLPSGDIFGK